MQTFEQQRAQQAESDLAVCEKAIRMCDWIATIAQDPKRREWAAQEAAYYRLRAESDRGLIHH